MQNFTTKESQNQEKFHLLRNTIFNQITKEDLPLVDLKVSVVSDIYANDVIKDCKSTSTLHSDKMSFLDSIFWNDNTFEFLRKKYQKNIIPIINYGSGIYITEENRKSFNLDYMQNFSKMFSERDNSEIYYFPRSKNSKKLPNLNGNFQRIVINFGRYEREDLVLIETISSVGNKITRISKTYRYENNKWLKIECLKIVNSSKVKC
ncbi:hypothetical protein [Chryseobacterium oryctis]|uniref:Uncharacterized protein n=1 Tax=Chryseobacterium oryctis TaxID=2952618 RepID=A0ABT3HK46_9FLAO|nr:hypothetical protein [Chryseobacterium oryctis]MCW3160164.1 hypothetical protein [Chryseobacterium oryctis]